MICCEYHQSGDCLDIVDSEIDIEDGEIVYVEEHYECRHRDLEGVYRFADDIENVQGAILSTSDRPLSLVWAKREGVQ